MVDALVPWKYTFFKRGQSNNNTSETNVVTFLASIYSKDLPDMLNLDALKLTLLGSASPIFILRNLLPMTLKPAPVLVSPPRVVSTNPDKSPMSVYKSIPLR